MSPDESRKRSEEEHGIEHNARPCTPSSGQVIQSSWLIVRKNIPILRIVAVVTYLLAGKFFQELEEFIRPFYEDEACVRLAQDISEKIPNRLKEDFAALPKFSTLAIGALYAIFLQVVVTQLAFDTLKSQQSSISPGRFAVRFQRAEFFSDVLRVLGITMILSATLMGGMLLLLFIWHAGLLLLLPEFGCAEGFVMTMMVVFPPLYLWMRWSLAIPVTVVENLSVWESLRSSWHMTRTCWIRLGAVILGLSGLALLIVPPLVLSGLEHAGLSNALADILGRIVSWVFEAVALMFGVIVVSVFYYYLRGDKKSGRLYYP